jgi:predicted HNH restriction endonuclease
VSELWQALRPDTIQQDLLSSELQVELLGGRCQRCGWDEHVAGFHFHHKDPSQKEFRIASGNTIAWDKIKTELEKCVLLCSNCHAVVHATSDPEWVVIPG